MTKEAEQSIGIIVETDPEETKFSANVQKWVDGEIRYTEVRQSFPNHDRPLIVRVVRHISREVVE